MHELFQKKENEMAETKRAFNRLSTEITRTAQDENTQKILIEGLTSLEAFSFNQELRKLEGLKMFNDNNKKRRFN